MGLALIACAAVAVTQNALNNTVFVDVPDNHYVYALLMELRTDGLLPETNRIPLVRGARPLTRGQVARYMVIATANLQQYVEEHREVRVANGFVTYSDTVSTFTTDQLKYVSGLPDRMRKVVKAFSQNFPPYVNWTSLDSALDKQGTVLDGLVAGA